MHVPTVSGPITPETLGVTLMHEHLLTMTPGRFFSAGREDDTVDVAQRALAGLHEHGLRTIVDLTGRSRAGSRPDIAALREISRRTSLSVVVGVSMYKAPYPAWVAAVSVDEIADHFVDLAEAAGAALYGEVGSSLDEITPEEENCLRAAARAQLREGGAISTHCTLGTMALEQVQILEDEGADLSRTVIGHLDLRPDIPTAEAVLRRGACVAFDTFGKKWFDYRVPGSEGDGGGEFIKWAYRRPDADRVAALAELVASGWERQLVVSCDISGQEAYMNPETHGRHGYAFLFEKVLPALRRAGVGEQALRAMLVDNPARILARP